MGMLSSELSLTLFAVGLAMVVAGVVLMILASIKMAVEGVSEGGGLILLGPIPIVWGTKKTLKAMIILTAVVILIIAFMWAYCFMGG